MKNEKSYKLIVFFFISFFSLVGLILVLSNYEGLRIKQRRSSLENLSEMFMYLSFCIEEDKADSVTMSAEFIIKSGDIDQLDSFNAENVYNFLNGIRKGRVKPSKESAAYARKCSTIAQKTLLGKKVTLEKYNVEQSIITDDLTTSIITAKSNNYSLSNDLSKKICEYVFIREAANGSSTDSISIDTVKTLIQNATGFSDEMGIKMYFSDFDTSFYLLEYNADIYIIGINTNNKKISHLRYVLKKDFYK